MTVQATEKIREYLADALAAEEGFVTELSNFATEGDDDEVKQLFAAHAQETQVQADRLRRRLEALGGSVSKVKSAAAHLFALAPRSGQIAHVPEERIVQNLMAAYSVEAAECAMYEALTRFAQAAGDHETVELARSIQTEEHTTADKLWTLLPSRSIIAYNMLTITEVDPSVETKIGEASWTP